MLQCPPDHLAVAEEFAHLPDSTDVLHKGVLREDALPRVAVVEHDSPFWYLLSIGSVLKVFYFSCIERIHYSFDTLYLTLFLMSFRFRSSFLTMRFISSVP